MLSHTRLKLGRCTLSRKPERLHTSQVSTAHEERLLQEKQLLATIRDLNEERESEKVPGRHTYGGNAFCALCCAFLYLVVRNTPQIIYLSFGQR